MIMIASDTDFHEGIVGIVAWRITEKNQKPSAIFSLNQAENIATASMRAPHWFSIIEMLDEVGHLLERYWGHEQAWWLTVSLDNLSELQEAMQQFATQKADTVDTTPRLIVDTALHDHECTIQTLNELQILAPYGMWNQSPLFVLEEVTIQDTRILWKWSRTHLKLTGQYGNEMVSCMQRWAGDDADLYPIWKKVSILGRLKEDTWTKGVMIEVKEIIG
jgi:single-stranded-DNA-specific exonuclease